MAKEDCFFALGENETITVLGDDVTCINDHTWLIDGVVLIFPNKMEQIDFNQFQSIARELNDAKMIVR